MKDLSLMRPVWEEIDLDAIAHNIRVIRAQTNKDALVTAVVKANALEHGSVQVAPVMLANGADRLAVATLEEALELRRAGIDAPILILGGGEPARADEIVQNDIHQAVYTFPLAKALSDAAVKAGKDAYVHIKVDSGMGRIGFLPREESLDEIEKILALPNIRFEGLFSHFSTADETDKAYTHEQFRRYSFIRDGLAARGLKPHIAHIANSAAIIDLPDYHLDMVRAGIILYGQLPSNEVQKDVLDLHPTMSIKARITNVKMLPDHEAVGYGRKYWTEGERKIATVPIGYADGYTRLLSNKADILVNGKRARIAGNICMDQCMIDVTGIDNVNIGDEVVIIGRQGDEVITLDEIADLLGTITYEVFCATGRRIPRVYKKDGKIIDTLDYLDCPVK